MALADFPRHPLAFGPSPLHPLRRLTAHLGGEVEIWAKREDVSSGLAFGGNKTRKLARIARRTADQLELGRELADEEIVLVDGYHAGIYGVPDEATIDAIRLAGRLEGMLTDPVYEGKSLAGMIDLIHRGVITPGSRVLYAHLGGQPALSAYTGVL